MPWRPGCVCADGRIDFQSVEPLPMRHPLLQPEEKKKNGSPLPANIDAASGYYKVIVSGELENEVQSQIGGISLE